MSDKSTIIMGIIIAMTMVTCVFSLWYIMYFSIIKQTKIHTIERQQVIEGCQKAGGVYVGDKLFTLSCEFPLQEN